MQGTFRFQVPVVVINVERQMSLRTGHALGGIPAAPEQTAGLA